MKTAEERIKKFGAKLQPEIIGKRFEAEKRLIVDQQLVKQTVQADIMTSVGQILDKFGITAQTRFLYQSFAGRVWRAFKNVGGDALMRHLSKAYLEYVLEGAKDEVLGRIFQLFGVKLQDVKRYIFYSPIDITWYETPTETANNRATEIVSVEVI